MRTAHGTRFVCILSRASCRPVEGALGHVILVFINDFARVADWAKVNDISNNRILLGEFGAIRSSPANSENDQDRAGYYNMMRSKAEAQGWAWSTWSWSGGFGLSRTDTSRDFDPTLMKALGLKH